MVSQQLDHREDPSRQDKLLEYCCFHCEELEGVHYESKEEELLCGRSSFEEYMRNDYANAELRSFCLLVQDIDP